MGKPRMIVLIRHGQSEGNKNRDIHQTIPDHRVKLTAEGWSQARDAGRRLRDLLLPTDTLHFFTSPYRRTRETTEGILETLTSDEPSPTPFPRQSIKVYEEPRLREQDFGNFQPCSAEMERMWQERADYGHFFYRIPNGESAADAYDRVSGFNESLWRQFGEDDCASVCVLVTHGLMSRVFLMKWYHFSVEYFEDLRNVNHCEFLIMRKSHDSGKYILENKLRTWSELKRERAAAQAIKDKDKDKEGAKDKAVEKLEKLNISSPPASVAGSTQSPIPVRKKWGGCPNGCDHGRHYHKKDYGRENSMHPMPSLHGNNTSSNLTPNISSGSLSADSLINRRPAGIRRWQSSSDEDSDDPRGQIVTGVTGGPQIDVERSLDDVVSSPDQTPSFITVEERLKWRYRTPKESLLERMGRDFGGSASGNTSLAESDTEISAAEENRLTLKEKIRINDDKNIANAEGSSSSNKGKLTVPSTVNGGKVLKQQRGEDRGKGRSRGAAVAMADALGDQDGEAGSDGEGGEADTEDLEVAERRDKSVKGSVY